MAVALPTPPDRLSVLRSYDILDTPREAAFDSLVFLASQACRVPLAWVSFLDDDREWVKASLGLEATSLPTGRSFAVLAGAPEATVIVPDTRLDPRLAAHEWVTGAPGLRFYAAAPIHGDHGVVLGVLAVADVQPRLMDAGLVQSLSVLAAQVEAQLDLRRLQAEREALASHVVHDLRNPIAALQLNAEFCLRETTWSAETREPLEDIAHLSRTLDRLVRDIGDVTRDGRTISPRPREARTPDLFDRLARQMERPGARAGARLAFSCEPGAERLELDQTLFLRICENLLDLAISRSPPGGLVSLSIRRAEDGIECRVSDEGPALDGLERRSLFDPHPRRSAADGSHNAARLYGLAFCRLAVDAQQGRIWAERLAGEGMAFCLRLPQRRPVSVPRPAVPRSDRESSPLTRAAG